MFFNNTFNQIKNNHNFQNYNTFFTKFLIKFSSIYLLINQIIYSSFCKTKPTNAIKLKKELVYVALDFAIIGQRLKKTRLEKKMTQESLAEQLDVSVAFLSRIERGLSHINLKRLSQICSILGVSEGYILNGTASTSEQYLISEFNEILSDCPADKQKLIYKIAKTIIEDDAEN